MEITGGVGANAVFDTTAVPALACLPRPARTLLPIFSRSKERFQEHILIQNSLSSIFLLFSFELCVYKRDDQAYQL
jgi:hypothetical protein